jgi:tRNA nucleotidyltransferase (CCA-adding enzyme)
MDLILCHTTADFDTLGAAVGLARLIPGASIVLTGGCHPAVRDFLALHRDEYALIERRSVTPEQIRSLTVVDTQRRDRLGKGAEWLDLSWVDHITVYDHHLETEADISASTHHLEAVGATTTLVAEQLQAQACKLTPTEATVMALGIHVDTGSLTFDHTTPRDARALAWLMDQGASVKVIAQYVEPGLSPALQNLLAIALEQLQTETLHGRTLAWVMLPTEAYIQGLSSLTTQLLDITSHDVLIVGIHYPIRPDNPQERLTLIGRAAIDEVNLAKLFQALGGGGHARAASVTLRGVDIQKTLDTLLFHLRQQIPPPLTARELMSSPVRTIRPDTTIAQAQRILLRYGHSGLSVVNELGQLVGIISRRDLDIAFHHGFGHAPAKGYMTTDLKTITPETLLAEIENLMITYDIGRLPVLQEGQLVGIVTRTDVLRHLHRQHWSTPSHFFENGMACELWDHTQVQPLLSVRLAKPLERLLAIAAQAAQARGWHLYLVGGAVRDLLLADSQAVLSLNDIDLVVDGFHTALIEAAGVDLAHTLQAQYPEARLEVHGRFQTAALLWHNDPVFDSLWIDIATARTEFYPYPAANPEVEASSIQQDLYRRDFTVNALALRLSQPRGGELLDFFGGCVDLKARLIRVLHPNSFIEDPTRIFRGVRFAVRLGFNLESQTESYIRYAIDSEVYSRTQTENKKVPALQTRLKAELKIILQASYWQTALQLLTDLGALRCIHPSLSLNQRLWQQLHWLTRILTILDAPVNSPHWQLRLELLLTALPPEDRRAIAHNLQLPDDTVERLYTLDGAETELRHALHHCDRPSQIFFCLKSYDLPTLLLVAIRSDRALRRPLLRFLLRWSQVSPPLSGDDLKALGYKPGRQFRQILDDLLAATLDGAIAAQPPEQRAQAQQFLAQHYPLPVKDA